VGSAKITDGMTCTILIGEKYMNTKTYEYPDSGGYDENVFTIRGGTNRWGYFVYIDNDVTPPCIDWGSPYSQCPFVMCDGSIRWIEPGTDIKALGLLVPNDGLPVEKNY
jgi:hypothetical protein